MHLGKKTYLTQNRFKLFKMKIYVNGIPFEIQTSKITKVEICDLIKCPYENSDIERNEKPFNESDEIRENDHFTVIRKSL